MSYFPESLMPSRVKQESVDVDGNKFVIGGSDHNRLDEEIRAIEKIIGVPILGVQGFSGTTNIPGCSVSAILAAIFQQLLRARDGQTLTTSGVVTVNDSTVVGYSGYIQFPTSWQVTTLEDDIPDDTTIDEGVLDPIDEVQLASVEGMPDEGYITIINDVSLGKSVVVHSASLKIFSPAVAVGKVGAEFFYDAQVAAAGDDLVLTATNLPAGLSVSGTSIVGTPTTAGVTTAVLTATSGGKTATLSLAITVAASGTPTITNTDLQVTAASGSPFTYAIKYTGVPIRFTATGLPGGLTLFGSTITGTPRIPATSTITLTAIDQFGGTGTANLSLTVT